MKHTLLFGILCAAVVMPLQAAPAPAAPAKTAPATMDQKTFNAKTQNIEKNAKLNNQQKAEAFEAMLKAGQLDKNQISNLNNRIKSAYARFYSDSVRAIDVNRSMTHAERSVAFEKILATNKKLDANQVKEIKSRIASAKVNDIAANKALTPQQKIAAYEAVLKTGYAPQNLVKDIQNRIGREKTAIFNAAVNAIEGKDSKLDWTEKAAAFEKMQATYPDSAVLKGKILMALYRANDTKAFEARLAQFEKTATPAEKWQAYTAILNANKGSMTWFQRGFWTVGTYEHWYRWTNALLKLDEAQPADKKLGDGRFHRDVAWGAYTCGLFDLAYKEIGKAIEMKHVDLSLASWIYLQKKDHAKLQALIDEQRKSWNYQRDEMFWRAVLFFDRNTCKDFDAKFQLAAPELKYVSCNLSSQWTSFAPKELGGKELGLIAKMTDVPAEFAGVKGTVVTTDANGLYRVPGKPTLKTPALYMQTFEAADDGFIRIGVGADWFFRVYVNGKEVLNRWGGNNKVPTAASNNTVVAQVKKGKNIIAIPMLSGNAGSEFCVGKVSDKMSSADKLVFLRRVSELYFNAKRYEVCRDIYSYTYTDMFRELKAKAYPVRFVKNPPRTADGFARSEFYNDWAHMESRFEPYADAPNIGNNVDISRFLKDAKQPEINKDWKTGICVLCNEEGVHLYYRGNDPKVEEVTTGKRTAGTFECTFRPAEDAPYNMWFFTNLPDAKDEVNIDFASPSPRYSLTDDNFLRDACMTPEAVVAHTFIPWYAFPRQLPFNGKCWYIGLQRWCAGGGFTVSGQVHELARMVNLQFNFTKEQETAIKRHICLTAFNSFNRHFDTGNQAYLWERDKELGDPEFYKTELEPLVKELREAGAAMQKEGADINMYYEKYLDQWANFGYVMEAKRKDYLKNKFFK